MLPADTWGGALASGEASGDTGSLVVELVWGTGSGKEGGKTPRGSFAFSPF